MTDGRDELERVATAVADGESVDWQHEDRTNRHLRGMLDRLRAIEKIAEVHRTPPSQRVTPKVESDPTRTIEPQATDAPVPPLPFTRWGHLEVGELIGSGGFGEVYRAWDPHLQKNVALKLVRADRAADARGTTRFLLEARLLARVTHENVLQVHGADVHEGRAGLWTDLIEGKTLEEILREEGRRGWEEAALIGRKMCMALAAVHAEGLTHHDVKTGNIMRGEAGRYLLMDFSTTTDRLDAETTPAADAAHPARVEAAGTADGHAAIGTPGFMAPERFVGRDSGRASDIYSLGVVLYRLVTRRFPIEAASTDALYQMHRRGESTPLRDLRPDLPDAFIRVVERALEPDPVRRFTSMGEMDRAIAEVVGGQVHEPPPEPEPGPEIHRFPSWAWLRDLVDRAPVRAAAAIAVVVVAAIIVLNLPTALDVDARLYRTPASGDRFAARADEALAAGATVAPGDHLYLEIKGNDPMYVYIVSHDEAGEAWVLFPLPDLDLQNPLPAGTAHRLPGTRAGKMFYWVVSSAGGEEEFVAIASRDPLKNFERQIASIPEAGSTDTTSRGPRGIGRLRGIGGLDPAPRPDDGDSWRPLAGIVEGIKERAAGDAGLWAWEIRLQNPGAAGDRP